MWAVKLCTNKIVQLRTGEFCWSSCVSRKLTCIMAVKRVVESVAKEPSKDEVLWVYTLTQFGDSYSIRFCMSEPSTTCISHKEKKIKFCTTCLVSGICLSASLSTSLHLATCLSTCRIGHKVVDWCLWTSVASGTWLLQLLLHPFNGLFSRTTWVSRHQKCKASLDLIETRDDGVLWWQWHQLDRKQTIYTSLQTDNHTNTSSLNFYRPDALPDTQPTVSKRWRHWGA